MLDIEQLKTLFCFAAGGYFGGMLCTGEDSFRVGICYAWCGFGRWWRKETTGSRNKRRSGR